MTMAPTARAARRELRRAASKRDARFLQKFFKTGPGEYAQGDRFLGVRVPATRRVARAMSRMPFGEIMLLLRSPYHEERLLALLLMAGQYRNGGPTPRETIYRAYLRNTDRINNWDLADLSAPHIVGPHSASRDPGILARLARSRNLWERRIAMLATFHHTRNGNFAPALRIARMLLADEHDLIHKAAGWMLREVANRNRAAAEAFLREHHARMPRTMLRYTIERFPPALRRAYLEGRVSRSAS